MQHVLAIYDTLRQPRASMVLERSIEMGEIFQSYRNNNETLRHRLTGMWEPVWNYDFESEVSEAIKVMEKDSHFAAAETQKIRSRM